MEILVLQALLGLLEKGELLETVDSQDPMDSQDQRVLKGNVVWQELPARKGVRGILAVSVNLDFQVQGVSQEILAYKVLKESLDHWELQEKMADLAHLVQSESEVNLALWGLLVQKATVEIRERQENWGTMVLQDKGGLLARMEKLVRRVLSGHRV